ncbi:hypothetical protein [Chitinibacter sp. S2-10]|uniref:hypothetical protein n=1 Tax=Chitinibacter sp. S2-10 TaxID=3373597 RepID=UPI0039775474
MRYFWFLAGCILGSAAQAVEPLRLVTVLPPELPATAAHKRFIQDLFQRIKTPYTLEYRPARRAIVEFKSGMFDGDAGRVSLFAAIYPEAIRVNPSFVTIKFYSLSMGNQLNIQNWADLRPYSVAYPRGIVAIESMLAPSERLNPVNSVDVCMKMLKARRVDSCILMNALISEREIEDARKMFTVQQFAELSVHLWLEPKHRALASQLSAALNQMQLDGSLQRYQHAILNPPEKP